MAISQEKKGVTIELMELFAEKAGIDIEIRFAPWKRAQILAENTPGSLIFTLAFSQSLSEKFQYIAPLMYTDSSFVTLNDRLDSYENARSSGKTIGVHLGSHGKEILDHLGFTNLIEVPSAQQMATMLNTGRIDAWYTMSLRARYMFRENGFDPERLVIGAPVSHDIQWLAANNSIDPDLRARLSKAVSNVWRDPRYWKIVDRYGQ
ncbi:amino acid ABC transporter substrate-binding protein [Rhodobacterales bacterium]|nr:amino acid ABC transporter substrate-binding protein [Rhodobacterales bacterium]